MSKLTTRIIIAATAALSYFAFVQANDEICGQETETVIIQPETTSYRIIPGTYEWVDGELNGYSLEYKVVPAEFETIEQKFLLQGPRTENTGWGQSRHMPAISKPYESKKIAREAYPVAKFMANHVKDGRTRIQTKQPKFEAIKIPAQTRTFTRARACEVISSAGAGN